MAVPLRILYVDDDRDIRHIVGLSLSLDSAMAVRMCASGAEALDIAADDDWRPDLVMLDVMMPQMSGLEVMAALRQEPGFATTPFVFVTAKARAADVAAYEEAGALGVILKPFDPLTLAQKIRRLYEGTPPADD